jgi:hypothetical protein
MQDVNLMDSMTMARSLRGVVKNLDEDWERNGRPIPRRGVKCHCSVTGVLIGLVAVAVIFFFFFFFLPFP